MHFASSLCLYGEDQELTLQSMWQERGGKKKKTYSKLFLAAFTSKSLAGVPTVGVPHVVSAALLSEPCSPPLKKFFLKNERMNECL